MHIRVFRLTNFQGFTSTNKVVGFNVYGQRLINNEHVHVPVTHADLIPSAVIGIQWGLMELPNPNNGTAVTVSKTFICSVRKARK